KKQIVSACHASEIGFIFYKEDPTKTFEILTGSTSFFTTEQGQLFSKELVKKMKQKKNEPVFSSNYKKVYKDLPFRSVMCIPMKQSGTIHGFTVIMHHKSSYFTFETFKLMQ